MISITEYQKSLPQRALKRVNLIHGEEDYLVKTLLEKLKSLYPVSIVWGDEVSLQDFERAITTGGMFGKEEVLFVYRAMDLLENVKDYKRFASFLERVRGKFIFFYVEAKLTDKDLQKEPFSTISRLGDVISAGKLDKKRIRELVKNKLQREGISIEESALDYLLEATSYQLMLLKTETDKLILYGKSKLTLEDIKAVLVADLEMSVFDFVDGIFLKDYDKALDSLKAVLKLGTHPLQVLTLLTNYALKLYTAKSLIEEGKRPEEALSLVDVKHSFQVLNFKRYLEKNSKQDLLSLLKRLYLLDISIKVYFSDPAASLKNFVVEYMLNEEVLYQETNAGDQDRAELEP
ncbi:MAG: DNA polymerase III subunit delta [Aquificaceae bacterium]